MQLHLTYLQFLSAAVVLVCVAFLASLALMAFVDDRRRKPPPFSDYLSSDFERRLPQRDLFTELDKWSGRNRARLRPHEIRKANPRDRSWK